MATAIPLEPVDARAAEVVRAASGRTLALWAPGMKRSLPAAAGPVEHWSAGFEPTGVYDSVVSVGGLGTAADLEALLRDLRAHLGPASLLHFCEPTIARQRTTRAPPHDVTTSLWRAGFSVIECWRSRERSGLRTHRYCWGRARLTPPTAPPRRWAEESRGSPPVGQ